MSESRMMNVANVKAKKITFEIDRSEVSDNKMRRINLIREEIDEIISESVHEGAGILTRYFVLMIDPEPMSGKDMDRIDHKLNEIEAVLRDRSI